MSRSPIRIGRIMVSRSMRDRITTPWKQESRPINLYKYLSHKVEGVKNISYRPWLDFDEDNQYQIKEKDEDIKWSMANSKDCLN